MSAKVRIHANTHLHSASESLEFIRPVWCDRLSSRLAENPEVRTNFLEALVHFYDLLIQAVQDSQPAILHPVLDEWIETRTQSEFFTHEVNLPPTLEQILLVTYDVGCEILDSQSALELIGSVLPVLTEAYAYSYQRETQLHIEHISKDLEKATLTLERLDKSKSDFIAIAAHELKTPLTLIEGYAAMLREQVSSQADWEGYQVLLRGIDNGTRRLREIVDDMIDVSMIDNDILSLNFQPVWLNRLMKKIQRDFQPAIEERQQTFEVHFFPGSEEMIFGDDERLYQALYNLLTNAIKFTPDGGKIKLDGRRLPGFIEITVSDNGIGIDPKDHLRIFEKFGRLGSVSLHSTGKTKFKGGGPGLGLHITKGIIEAHGGAIWAESDGYNEKLCPGTTFHALIPLRKEPPDYRAAQLFGGLFESRRESVEEPIIIHGK